MERGVKKARGQPLPWGLKRPQEAGTEFARNHSGSLETKAPPTACAVAARNLSGPPRRSQKRLEQARRGRNSRETTTQRNSCETTAGAWKRRPRPTACAAAVGNLSGPPRRGRNSRETTVGASKYNGIRAKSQRQHRNATEFARNHSGSVETKAPSHRARRCGRQPKWPPQKRPEEATTGRNSRETTETQRNSRETTAGASKPRPRPTARAVVVGNLSGPPRRGCRGLNSRETTAGASKCNGICAKPQRQHRNATEFARNHSGSVETKAPSHRARRCSRQPKWPPQKRPEEATRGRNSRETTGGASKCNRIRAKPQREHRNATEFARNHSGSVEPHCASTVWGKTTILLQQINAASLDVHPLWHLRPQEKAEQTAHSGGRRLK